MALPSSNGYIPNLNADDLPTLWPRCSQCWQFPDLLISPSHTDGVKPIYTLLTLYHKTHGSFGFKHTILVPFAFATWSLALLALRCLKLLRSFWDNPSPAPSPNEQGINRNIGLRYHGPFATFVVFLQWHLLRFLTCGFCDDTCTDLIVTYPIWQFACLTDF